MDDARDRIELANVIKGVHKKLRIELKKSGNVEALWSQHTNDKESLQKYATSMHRLATKYWQNTSNMDPKTSRINWTRSIIQHYFFEGGIEKERKKDTHNFLVERHHLDTGKVRVLDVGSCYNPFSMDKNFDVIAIDLCPAVDSVLQCDFLTVPIHLFSQEEITTSNVCSFKTKSFHVVVFSLLLEYFPSPIQRWVVCKKASEILKAEGILIIITPDSKAAHANSQVMRSWRTALGFLGLRRIAYEKLPHVHCMAFRKSIANSIHKSEEEIAKLMYIPQDLQEITFSDDGPKVPRPLDEEISDGFRFLPDFCD